MSKIFLAIYHPFPGQNTPSLAEQGDQLMLKVSLLKSLSQNDLLENLRNLSYIASYLQPAIYLRCLISMMK